ncbi:nucleotidyltransferase domain-containing protein [Staphylococcus kloosii]|jgi:predicted nucleotidyltransferase|uniref:Nucleotidyltransferase domain-containing protein n=1 Tax=Staphylococcus kloosii TaxID=29384 RepID=A0A921KWZ0_9STAP|nr:nucleotidyltransferase domain-containing protein [Staphylococcus kloosii]PTJ75246.1 DNA polymerase subunit beta [Staphylococcus kloosii]HJF69067.1 nucleotidyltransferase domain-containing protein [Staphylococcus kloosii]
MNAVDHTIQKIVEEISGLPGVVGVVLGGSRAKGNHRADSDIDIGIYYDETQGFNTDNIEKAALKINDEKKDDLITSLGDWGEWINGGGWLLVNGYHVDLIFRNIKKVNEVIKDCLSGKVTIHYQTGHPHGFLNVMYMGELNICKILADPQNKLIELKNKTFPYPPKVKQSITQFFAFEASFSFMFIEDNINKNDISYIMGHLFRCISCLNQVIFAKNEIYCINEKKSVAMINEFPIKPKNYKNRIDNIVSSLSMDEYKTKQSIEELRKIIEETNRL